MKPVDLDAEAILAVLLRHDVRFVVIGGYAAVLHGLPRATEDIDITPSTDDENLQRLAAALDELEARLLAPGAEELLDWPWSAESLRAFTTVTTRTRHGDLDIAFRPDAPGGGTFDLDHLERRAELVDLGIEVPVASLEDVIASKRAADRPKDHEAMRMLTALLDARRRG